MEEKNNEKCLNCGNELVNNPEFCPHCGQQNKKIDLKFRHFFHDFLSSNFNLDSKIFLTLRLLVFHPGKLSKEFLEGKWTKYVTPVRLYLIISLLYFSVLSLTNTGVKLKETKKGTDNVVFELNETDTTAAKQAINVDSMISTDSANSGSFKSFMVSKLKKMQNPEGRKEFNAKLRGYISMGMFVLIPLTALILFWLFHKNSFYLQHLVFIIHLQSLMFLVFTVFNLLYYFWEWSLFGAINTLLFLFLLYVWIWKFYELKWMQAVWKTLAFLLLYLVVFMLFLASVAGLSFYML